MSEALVWYASYGSNLFTRRFACYLAGGRPPGASRSYPGARDHTPPRDSRAMRLPGQVFFAARSDVWQDGGVAFLDTAVPSEALLRAYRITHDQFADVVAQEMHRPPGPGLDMDRLLGEGRLVLGPGLYETLLVVAQVDGSPVVTFTCPDGAGRPATNAPSAAYLRMIAAGLRQSHGLDTTRVLDYLMPLPGVAGHWDASRLGAVVDGIG